MNLSTRLKYLLVEPDLRRFDRMLRWYRQPGPDVLGWHDSSWHFIAREDTDRRMTGVMIAEQLDVPMQWIGSGGYQPGIYQPFARALVRQPHHPRVVVFPVNLPRCTAVQWFRRPDLRFDAAIAVMDRWVRRPRPLVWVRPRDFPSAADDAAYEALPSPSRFSEKQLVRDFVAVKHIRPTTDEEVRQRQAEIFAFHFGHPVDPGHERLRQLADTVTTLEGAGIRCVTYATPINVEAGDELLGPAFRPHVAAHVAAAQQVLADAGARTELVDWHDALPRDVFFHRYYAAEHLKEDGRRWVADRVSDLIRAELKATS